MKVSVVIPVYNPGVYIEPLIESLAAQTMPQEDFEAIFVDDGSTDETPARLARLAADRSNVRVITQENSHWPGRPRNVGTAAAFGDFVYYCDHDDWLGVRALERLHAMALHSGADIVIGKMAGHRRGVPRALFRETVERAFEPDVPLAEALTPHKLFRRDFLNQNRLRFPEGRRRLEDHVFVVRALVLASVVSVVADEVCYHHSRRGDTGNAAYSYVSPTDYFGYVREQLDILDELDATTSLRKAVLTRTLRMEMLQRLEGQRMLDYRADYRTELLGEIRKLLLERYPVDAELLLSPRQRPLVAAARVGNVDALMRIAQWQARVRVEARLEGIDWRGEALRLTCSVRLSDPDGALVSERPDGMVLASYPEVLADLASVRLEGYARTRDRSHEVRLPVTSHVLVDQEGALVVTGYADFAVATAPSGAPLAGGIWDISVWVEALGWFREIRLGARRTEAATVGCRPALIGRPGRLVMPYWTKPRSALSVHLDARPAAVGKALLGSDVRTQHERGRRSPLAIGLPLHVTDTHAVSVRLSPPDRRRPSRYLPARLEPAERGSLLVLRRPAWSGWGPRGLALLLPETDRAVPFGVMRGSDVGVPRPGRAPALRKVLRRTRRYTRALRHRIGPLRPGQGP